MKKKKPTNEGILDATEKFVNAFFAGLEKNSVDRIIKQAEKAKLPPAVVANMKEIDELRKELRQLLDLI